MTGSRPVLVTSKAVKRFLSSVTASLQRQAMGLTLLQKPTRVAVWCDVRLYSPKPDKANAATSDLDNMVTMLVETLQTTDRPSGVAGVIQEDSQVFFVASELQLVPSKSFEGATVYVWAHTNVLNDLPVFLTYKEARHDEKSELEIPFSFDAEDSD